MTYTDRAAGAAVAIFLIVAAVILLLSNRPGTDPVPTPLPPVIQGDTLSAAGVTP